MQETERLELAARVEAEDLAERAGIDMLDDYDRFIEDLTETLLRFRRASLPTAPAAEVVEPRMLDFETWVLGYRDAVTAVGRTPIEGDWDVIMSTAARRLNIRARATLPPEGEG